MLQQRREFLVYNLTETLSSDGGRYYSGRDYKDVKKRVIWRWMEKCSFCYLGHDISGYITTRNQKVKEQATKAQRRSRGIVLLFL